MANTHETAGTLSTARKLIKSYETSAANTALTVSTPTTRGRPLRLLAVLVKYSAAVTQNVTVTYNAGHGAAYDAKVHTIALSTVADGAWLPDAKLVIDDTDALDVAAPAGGLGVTVSITVLCEEF